MGWIKGRICANCGSSMVTWRFKEPHCWNCGCNVPFSTIDHRDNMSASAVIEEASKDLKPTKEAMERDYMETLHNLTEDKEISLAHLVIRFGLQKRKKKKTT